MNGRKVSNGRVSRRKACSNKKKKSSIPSLPEEIIFCILVWLPADILYNSMRYVCRQWYNIIHDPLFIKEHLLRCTTGLFIQGINPPYSALFADLGKMNVTVTQVSLPFPRIVLATCDGLVLLLGEQNTLHVANPVTKRRLLVPSFSWPSEYPPLFSLAYARSTMECKVLSIYKSDEYDGAFKCMMITLGKDHAWKLINSNKLSDPYCSILGGIPVYIEGFFYWDNKYYTYVVALDVESEMFYEFPRPAVKSKSCGFSYVARGKSLSCLVRLIPGTLFDVFVLSDPMSGEWRKIHKIDLAQKCTLSDELNGLFSWPAQDSFFIPIAWVKNEVVICRLHIPGPYITHDVKTGETFIFGSFGDDAWRFFWSDYAYSLVSLTSS